VRSVSQLTIVGVGLTLLAGCTTTQQKAARLQLNNARIRLNETRLRLAGQSSEVRVTSVNLLTTRSRSEAAVVVTVRNQAPKPVSDLPLLVGLNLPGGHRTDLNAASGMSYFRNHLPAIPAHGGLTWVLTLHRRIPAGAKPFAVVGTASPTTATAIGALPALRVASVKTNGSDASFTVLNSSSVSQYQLPVYALARRGQRLVAAGQTAIGELDGGDSAQLRLAFVGDPTGASLSFEAPPTIFK
jgi:hypothetical protein